MKKDIKFSKSESNHLLKQPLFVVLRSIEKTMEDLDASDVELHINGVSYDFFIRATKQPSENLDEIKPD